jgi:hypothetical protein
MEIPSPEEILHITEGTLDEVLAYFREQGITVQRPTLSYVDEEPSEYIDAALGGGEHLTLAQIGEEKKLYKERMRKMLTWMGVLGWEYLGVQVTTAAVEEISHSDIVEDSLDVLLSGEPEERNHITLYRSFADEVRYRLQGKDIIAHEVWHLIEQERGLLESSIFIMEGTAEFARRRMRGKMCTKTPEECVDIVDFFYRGVANIVQRIVDPQHPFTSLLEPEYRARISEETLRCMETAFRRIVGQITDEQVRVTGELLRRHPSYQSLIGNVTPENIILLYEQLGGRLLATELRSQDLTKVVVNFQKMGF